jgi:hypothetical protein
MSDGFTVEHLPFFLFLPYYNLIYQKKNIFFILMSDHILTFHIEGILAISCKSLSFQDGILQCLASSPSTLLELLHPPLNQ